MNTNYSRETSHKPERFQRTHVIILGRRHMNYELRML
jgi:hypothetical protein